MSEDLTVRISRAESDIAALQRQYDRLEADVKQLREDVGDLKSEIGNLKLENARHFSEVKDLLNGVTSKALNSLPPWGAILTILLGGMVGAVTGWLLR